MKRLIALAFLVLCLALPVLAGDTQGPPVAGDTQGQPAAAQSVSSQVLTAVALLLLKLRG